MKEYDTNQDGQIDQEEMKKSPPLLEAVEPFEWESHTPMDVNGDRMLTEDEIGDRIAEWLRSGVVVLTQSSMVTLDGEPLEGATVTYEPEAFLGAAIQPTSAVTDETGTCFPAGQDEKYPGLYTGLYRVRISKKVGGAETIPACYNTETILGKELAEDAPSTHRLLVYDLKSEGE